MILSMVIGGKSIHKYVLNSNVPKFRDASVYMHFQYLCQYCSGLTLTNVLIFTMCHMDLVLHCILSTADSSL